MLIRCCQISPQPSEVCPSKGRAHSKLSTARIKMWHQTEPDRVCFIILRRHAANFISNPHTGFRSLIFRPYSTSFGKGQRLNRGCPTEPDDREPSFRSGACQPKA